MKTERLLDVLVLGGAALVLGCSGGAETGDGGDDSAGAGAQAVASSASGVTGSGASGGAGGADGSGGASVEAGGPGSGGSGTGGEGTGGEAASGAGGASDGLTCKSNAPGCPLPCCWAQVGSECDAPDGCCG